MASPIKFAHVVLRTANYEQTVAWWLDFLQGEVRHANDFITFLSYDDEHHRIAIINSPQSPERPRGSIGTDHIAFTYETLDDLLDQFGRMKARGVHPYFQVHHGMTLSAYYRDPDGNQVETQIDTLTLLDAETFMDSPVFAANPIGVKVDFDDIVARRNAGESVAALTDYAAFASAAK